jgi:predicted HTH transcriptional regulator
MFLEMEKLGLEPPIFEEYAFMVRTTLRNNLEKRGLKLPARAEMTDELAELNQRQHVLLAYLREHESVSRAEYEQLFGVGHLTAKSDLQGLITKGLIQRFGAARATRYRAKK